MHDLFLQILKQIVDHTIDSIEPYFDFLHQLEDLLYFKLPVKLREETWTIWTIKRLGVGALLIINEGDYRIQFFEQHHRNNKTIFSKFNSETLLKHE